MEYIVRILLTLVIWIFLVLFIPRIIPDFGMELGETATTVLSAIVLIVPLILGWILSGKIVESDVYQEFAEEIICTPNNAQLKAILLPTVPICTITFIASQGFAVNGFDSFVGWLFFGSLGYGIISIKFWFWGGFLGANSTDYENKIKLNLSSFWALMAPLSVALAVWEVNYILCLSQLFAMLAVRVFYFIKSFRKEPI